MLLPSSRDPRRDMLSRWGDKDWATTSMSSLWLTRWQWRLLFEVLRVAVVEVETRRTSTGVPGGSNKSKRAVQ